MMCVCVIEFDRDRKDTQSKLNKEIENYGLK